VGITGAMTLPLLPTMEAMAPTAAVATAAVTLEVAEAEAAKRSSCMSETSTTVSVKAQECVASSHDSAV
jgi:hypothetical protein